MIVKQESAYGTEYSVILIPESMLEQEHLSQFIAGNAYLVMNSDGQVETEYHNYVKMPPVAPETAAGNDSEAEINRVNALLEAYDKGWVAATKQFSTFVSPKRNGFGQDIT